MSRGAATCPGCKSGNTRVYETRHRGRKTLRRLLCLECGKKWRTVEEAGLNVGWVRSSAYM